MQARGRDIMSPSVRSIVALLAAAALWGGGVQAQRRIVDPAANALPDPNPTVITRWGTLPEGRTWGSTAGVDIGPDGHVWAYDRCGANACEGSDLDPILKFDRSSGTLLARFGGGMLVFPTACTWIATARSG